MTKKTIILIIIFVIAAGAAVIGLRNYYSKEPDNKTLKPDIPVWYTSKPISNEKFYLTGKAKLENTDLALKKAANIARASITHIINSSIKKVMKEVILKHGGKVEFSVIDFLDDPKQISPIILINFAVEQRYIANDGTAYVLVSYPRSHAEKMVESTAVKLVKRYEALYEDRKFQTEKLNSNQIIAYVVEWFSNVKTL